jgi:glycerol-3-phosphate dehydrogenase
MRPLAVMAGLRPLLRAEGPAGELSREHAIHEEHGVLSVAGGKYTTFRVMARDTLERVLRQLGRPHAPLADPEVPLPVPPADELPLERRVQLAVREGFARRIEDVLRRRGHLWLSPDRGRGAAGEVARIMATMLGWSEERERREVSEWDVGVHLEERLLDRAGWPPA